MGRIGNMDQWCPKFVEFTSHVDLQYISHRSEDFYYGYKKSRWLPNFNLPYRDVEGILNSLELDIKL